jgi:hypothetical protein
VGAVLTSAQIGAEAGLEDRPQTAQDIAGQACKPPERVTIDSQDDMQFPILHCIVLSCAGMCFLHQLGRAAGGVSA